MTVKMWKLTENHARVDTTNTAHADENGSGHSSSRITNDVVCLPRKGGDNQAVGTGNTEESTDVSRGRRVEESGHAETNNSNQALEDNKRSSKLDLIGEPRDSHSFDDGEERRRSAENEGHLERISKTTSQNDGQEEEEGVNSNGTSHVHQRKGPRLPISGSVGDNLQSDLLSLFGTTILSKSGLDESSLLGGKEGVGFGVGEVDDDEPRNETGNDCDSTFNDEDPSPTARLSVSLWVR